MKLVSPNRQLKLLTNTLAAVSEAPDEESKVNAIFDTFTKLGFSENIRCRIAVVEEAGTVLAMKYGRGDYGSINLRDIRYNIGESITGRALREEKPLPSTFNQRKSTYSNLKSTCDRPIYSSLAMPLVKNGKPVGVLSLDSLVKDGFSRECIRALIPYSYLLAEVLSPSVGKHEDDIISSVRRFRKKQVLVLGKDTGPEAKYLTIASDILRAFGYFPLLVKDYPDIPELSNEEKVRVLADTSRFVVLENTFPAGQIVECKMCATNRILCASIRQSGKGSSYMVTDYFKDFDFMAEFEYDDSHESMEVALRQAIEWAEQKIKERIDYYNSIYPWRKEEILKVVV